MKVVYKCVSLNVDEMTKIKIKTGGAVFEEGKRQLGVSPRDSREGGER